MVDRLRTASAGEAGERGDHRPGAGHRSTNGIGVANVSFNQLDSVLCKVTGAGAVPNDRPDAQAGTREAADDLAAKRAAGSGHENIDRL